VAVIRAALLSALLAATACTREPDARETERKKNPPPLDVRTPRPPRLDATTTRDLTGDGAAERVVATAIGPSFDSMAVRLEIRDGRTGAVLYVARWSTRDYFKYERPSDAAARERTVRQQFEQLLLNAFNGPTIKTPDGVSHTAVDTAAVRYHLLELDWRRAHGIADTMPTPPDAESEIGRPRPTTAEEKARIAAVVAEVRDRPNFTFHQGGELTYTIAWSDREHAFVRIQSCC
jgi:hypothetical protein